FVGGTGVGQWRPTPPAFAPMAAPWLGKVTPFALKDTAWVQGVVATPCALIDARRRLLRRRVDHFRMLPECGSYRSSVAPTSTRRRLRAVSMCFAGTASTGSLREGAKRPTAGWRGCPRETRPLRMNQE